MNKWEQMLDFSRAFEMEDLKGNKYPFEESAAYSFFKQQYENSLTRREIAFISYALGKHHVSAISEHDEIMKIMEKLNEQYKALEG